MSSNKTILSHGAKNNLTTSALADTFRHKLIQHYNLETIVIDPKFTSLSVTNADMELVANVELTDNEINPFHANDIPLGHRKTSPIERDESCRSFSQTPMSFAKLDEFLVESFGSYEQNQRRPYPSAGGLYPVDVFVAILPSRLQASQTLTSGIYHFRPIEKCLQPLIYLDEAQLQEQLICKEFDIMPNPHVILMYSMQLSKATLKYSFRGYRNAVIEVGLMAQSATLSAQSLNLGSCIWGGFADHHIRKLIQLDPLEHLPLMMQYVGEKDV